SCSSAEPTPPAAAVTTTRSPPPTHARRHAYHAVRNTTGTAAASTRSTPSGTGKTRRASTTSFSAWPPKIGRAATPRPAAKAGTPAAADSTTPETWSPGTNGGRGVRGYAPERTKRSAKLRPIAAVRTSTSPAPGTGSGRSRRTSRSGPPYFSTNQARERVVTG